jgi:hypothetical protein
MGTIADKLNGILASVDAIQQAIADNGGVIDDNTPLSQYAGIIRTYLAPPQSSLDAMSWADIKKVSDAGLASEFWTVGEVKNIVLNGTVGDVALDNFSCLVRILGFDHNSQYEGVNKIHFQLGWASNIKPIAFNGFQMNPTASNTGGWEASNMRNVILKDFENVLPADLLNVIKPVTKYTDNVGGNKLTVAANVTPTEERLFLLSTYEEGNMSDAVYNNTEKTYQKVYDYYIANPGNASRIRYRHTDAAAAIAYWQRSVTNSTAGFRFVPTGGGNDTSTPNYSAEKTKAIAPGFCV